MGLLSRSGHFICCCPGNPVAVGGQAENVVNIKRNHDIHSRRVIYVSIDGLQSTADSFTLNYYIMSLLLFEDAVRCVQDIFVKWSILAFLKDS